MIQIFSTKSVFSRRMADHVTSCLAMMSPRPLIGSCCSRCLDGELQDVRRLSHLLTSPLLQTSRLRRHHFLVT